MPETTKDVILRSLRIRGKCSVKELADEAGISPVSVRHHLSYLQAGGWVTSEELRHGVGRPRLQFSLTDRALDLFPSRYFQLTHRLLEEIKGSMPEETVQRLFSGVATTMAEAYAKELDGLPLEERLRRLVESLAGEGFDSEVETRQDVLLIHELSCPYFRMGQDHPEVCLVDQMFIAKALSVPVERVTFLLDGHAHCTFAVSLEPESQESQPDVRR
jgi:DeoR family suf operon transcriptional repressor